MIVRVKVVLNRSVVACWQWLTFWQPVLWSSSESKWIVSRPLMVLNSGYWPDWSIKSQCYWSFVNQPRRTLIWLWRLVILLVRFVSLLSQLHSRLLLFKLSVVMLFSCSWFCLVLSISCFYSAGNYWLQFSGICSKVVNQLSKLSRW